MHREGHIGLALLLFSTFSFIFNFWNNTALVISLIFSVVPDYDMHLQRQWYEKVVWTFNCNVYYLHNSCLYTAQKLYNLCHPLFFLPIIFDE